MQQQCQNAAVMSIYQMSRLAYSEQAFNWNRSSLPGSGPVFQDVTIPENSKPKSDQTLNGTKQLYYINDSAHTHSLQISPEDGMQLPKKCSEDWRDYNAE